MDFMIFQVMLRPVSRHWICVKAASFSEREQPIFRFQAEKVVGRGTFKELLFSNVCNGICERSNWLTILLWLCLKWANSRRNRWKPLNRVAMWGSWLTMLWRHQLKLKWALRWSKQSINRYLNGKEINMDLLPPFCWKGFFNPPVVTCGYPLFCLAILVYQMVCDRWYVMLWNLMHLLASTANLCRSAYVAIMNVQKPPRVGPLNNGAMLGWLVGRSKKNRDGVYPPGN